MRKVIYSMGVSLDGFIAGPGDNIDWSVPDEELHRFHNERVREIGVQLCGRRLYETMVYWETADQDPELSEYMLEFARIWKPLPKIVFSSTLERVVGNWTLMRDGLEAEVAKLLQKPGGDVAVGGAGLAASLIERNLIDEYQLFIHPVVLGAGTPFFPAGRPQDRPRAPRFADVRIAGRVHELPACVGARRSRAKSSTRAWRAAGVLNRVRDAVPDSAHLAEARRRRREIEPASGVRRPASGPARPAASGRSRGRPAAGPRDKGVHFGRSRSSSGYQSNHSTRRTQ